MAPFGQTLESAIILHIATWYSTHDQVSLIVSHSNKTQDNMSLIFEPYSH